MYGCAFDSVGAKVIKNAPREVGHCVLFQEPRLRSKNC